MRATLKGCVATDPSEAVSGSRRSTSTCCNKEGLDYAVYTHGAPSSCFTVPLLTEFLFDHNAMELERHGGLIRLAREVVPGFSMHGRGGYAEGQKD